MVGLRTGHVETERQANAVPPQAYKAGVATEFEKIFLDVDYDLESEIG